MSDFDWSWIIGRPDRDARVYVIYGTDHECLYVGMTSDINQRMRQHSYVQPWWSEVTDIASFECDSREDARHHENALQELLQPARCTTPTQRAAALAAARAKRRQSARAAA